MKVNKILAGLVVAGVCGAGLTAMASSNDGGTNKTVEVKPVNTTTETSIYTGENVTTSEIESYIVNKYGSNWAADLLEKNGDEWDDILENELEAYFGYKYDNLIDDVIEIKENELDIDDLYDDDYTVEDKTKKDEIVKAIENKYGTNWANDLLAKNGTNWDDILENELEKQYGEKHDDIIEDIIDAKEYESGLDLEYNDNDDYYDNDHDDFDDIYDYND